VCSIEGHGYKFIARLMPIFGGGLVQNGVPMAAPLLSIQGLRTEIRTGDGIVRAVDGLDLEIGPGETVGLVGESGCGKSMTALSIMRLLPRPNAAIAAGRILFDGSDLAALDEAAMRRIRGDRIAMIFQEPMTSLNPVMTVGRQIAEALIEHRGADRRTAQAGAVELLARVGIPSPAARARDYPHRFSGGMRQRAMIAMAMACRPRLLIADEPTTALDVTIQAQILDLIAALQAETGMAVLLITHNFGIVADRAQRMAVMYAGRVVEEGTTASLFDAPAHPYTRGLLASLPRLGDKAVRGRGRLAAIPGIVPRLTRLPAGCAFAPRCAERRSACAAGRPGFTVLAEPPHRVRCFVHGEAVAA